MILPDIRPAKYSSVCYHRIWNGCVGIKMNQSTAMTHPLRGNSPGVITEYPEFKIFPRIERDMRLTQKPPVPVCILFPDCSNIGITRNMPAGIIIIPDLFYFRNLSQFPGTNDIAYL